MDENQKPGVMEYLMNKLKESFQEPPVPLMLNGKIVDRNKHPEFAKPEMSIRPSEPISGNPYVNPQEGLQDLKNMMSPEQPPTDPRFQKLVKPKY